MKGRIGTVLMVCALAAPACSSSSQPSCPSTPAQTIATAGANVLPVTVNLGPLNEEDNIVFTSVVICAPGSTTNCQTIPDIQVDTGSSGLRVLSSALSLSLPQATDANGNPLVECLQFVSSYSWGSVRTADVQIAGEQAHGIPIQLIGDPQFPAVPDSCSSTGPSSDTLDTFGANGLLGIGVARQDCGIGCEFLGAANPNLYYTCQATPCVTAAVSLAQQLPNPVLSFAADNNGSIIELPAISCSGAATASGSVVFGIGTQSNNGLGAAKVLTGDINGLVTTVYQGQGYSDSVFDTGSDAVYFLDSGTAGLPLCSDDPNYYCPSNLQVLSATVQGVNGASSSLSFAVESADTLFSNGVLSAFNDLAGPNPDFFDWGLPIFYGRNLFVAITSQSTPAGPGPYWAF